MSYEKPQIGLMGRLMRSEFKFLKYKKYNCKQIALNHEICEEASSEVKNWKIEVEMLLWINSHKL